MTPTTDLFTRALELPLPERAALAHQLLLSLETEPFDPDSETLWDRELQARLERVEKGQFSARDWRDALADIRSSLSQGSSS
jgi:Putative addiction module component